MKDFYSLLISFIFMSLAESVDLFFNNAISINTIIVTSSFTTIHLLGRSFGEIGIYTYRVVRKKESSYLMITLIASIITAFIVLIFKDALIDCFDISTSQKELLDKIINLYILFLPTTLVDNGFCEIIRLKGELKLYRKSLILFYVSLIGLDVLAYVFTKSLLMLFIATIIAHWINITYLIVKTKLRIELFTKEDLKNAKKYGIPIVLERIVSRIFLMIYGILASRLSETQYAIHSVCYSVCVNLEIITNAYNASLMIMLPEAADFENRKMNLRNYMKKCFVSIVILNIFFGGVTVFIQHGSLELSKCFPYIIFYCLTFIGLYIYESYKALCVVQGKPKILLAGSSIGVIIRVLICLLFIKSNVALYIFGIANTLDFLSRGLIFMFIENKENRSI